MRCSRWQTRYEKPQEKNSLTTQNGGTAFAVPPPYIKYFVIAPRLKILFLYLYNGRAHTLEAAINLYHKELHYQKMEEIAKQQARQAQVAYYAQMQAISEEAQECRETLNEIKGEVASARRSVENIEFNTDMIFWLNLMNK